MENKTTVNVCEHEWNFSVIPMENSNLFIETCLKCLDSIKTLELFKD